jgi:murein DD-endopeptidase MepM/ murein hydrolase activator NlpD
MRRRWKIAAGVWLAGALLTGAAGVAGTDLSGLRVMDKVYAAPQESGEAVASPEATEDTAIVNDGSYQGRLDAAEQKQQKLKEEKKALEKKLDNIQDFTDDVSKYVSTLDMQMTNLLDNIDANKEDIEDIKEEIQSVNEEYDNALSRQQEQYDGMKAHIKYMYENSDSNYLVYLMKSRTLAEFLSREEYVEKVTNYDKVLLNKYQQVLDEVTIARQKAEEKQREVTATKNSLKYEKEKLEQLSDEKTRQINIYQGLVADNRQNVASYAAQIADQEKEVEAILQEGRDKISQSEKSGDSVQIMPTNGEYAWPLPVSGRITSTFGYRKAPTAGASSYHKGVDIAVNTGTNVLACKEGKVVTAAYSSSAGNYVAIYHGGGIYSYYMHCSQLKTSVGKHVEKGQVIARSGSTGISTGPHLHFAMYKSGNYVNPMYYVKQP